MDLKKPNRSTSFLFFRVVPKFWGILHFVSPPECESHLKGSTTSESSHQDWLLWFLMMIHHTHIQYKDEVIHLLYAGSEFVLFPSRALKMDDTPLDSISLLWLCWDCSTLSSIEKRFKGVECLLLRQGIYRPLFTCPLARPAGLCVTQQWWQRITTARERSLSTSDQWEGNK